MMAILDLAAILDFFYYAMCIIKSLVLFLSHILAILK